MTERPAWINQSLHALTWDVLRPYAIIAAVGVIALASCTMAHSEPAPGRDIDKPVQTRARISQSVDANGNGARILIGGRPAGCPRRYCGCGLARHLGLKDNRLNLAWSWAKIFPRTSAAPGMAAVRRGHVMLLQSHVEGSRWIVRDYNGGRGLSWIHERDVRGFVFVNPNGAYAEKRNANGS